MVLTKVLACISLIRNGIEHLLMFCVMFMFPVLWIASMFLVPIFFILYDLLFY